MRTLKNKLNKREQEELFIKLARAMSAINNPTDAAEFLKDLLSEPEMLMLARRLQIAELLIEGWTYEEIQKNMKASFGTIAKVQTWLTLYGDGYRKIAGRISIKTETQDTTKPFEKLKRKYPMYFWPEIVLDELVKNASKREKEKLQKILGQLKDKTKLSYQLTKLLNQD